MIMGASSPAGHAHGDRSGLAVPGRLPAGIRPRGCRGTGQIGPRADATATGLVLTPWQGLGVVGLWTAGALLLGGTALRLRDA
jgi:hypothetical protein